MSGPRERWTRRAADRPRLGGRPVLLVGLTGGIATGKSSVNGMLREAGAPVLDADEIVHELMKPGGAAVEPILARFGEALRDDAGGVDRRALGRVVFRDEEARRRLEALVHPLVLAESESRLEMMAAAAGVELVVYDAALLVETGRHRRFDRLVVVTCDREAQMRRLMDRDGLDADEAGARIRAQWPLERKVALADYVIDNSGPWHATRKRVEEVLAALREDAAALRAALAAPGERARALGPDGSDESE